MNSTDATLRKVMALEDKVTELRHKMWRRKDMGHSKNLYRYFVVVYIFMKTDVLKPFSFPDNHVL